jgi:dynein heavy chain
VLWLFAPAALLAIFQTTPTKTTKPKTKNTRGLRAIKSVLVVAGSLLRAEPGQDEAQVLFRALRDFNVPKILAPDMVIFSGLLADLFPGVDPPRKRDAAFEDAIREAAREMRLAPDDDFVLRVVQLSELLAIRHCVFLMGPTGCGRTECYRVRFVCCVCLQRKPSSTLKHHITR